MPNKEAENLTLLRSHLAQDSLSSKLVAAYEQSLTPSEAQRSLDAVLNARLEEVRDAIEHGKAKLG